VGSLTQKEGKKTRGEEGIRAGVHWGFKIYVPEGRRVDWTGEEENTEWTGFKSKSLGGLDGGRAFRGIGSWEGGGV